MCDEKGQAMKVELNEPLRDLIALLESYPRKQALDQILSMPSAHLPLSNSLQLRDELGSRGPWGDSLLTLLYYLTNKAPMVTTKDKEMARESLEVLWSGHEKLSQVASLQNTIVGTSWIPREHPEPTVSLRNILASINLFLEEKVERYGITPNEVKALRSLAHIGNKYAGYLAGRIHNPFHEGDYCSTMARGTATENWIRVVKDDYRSWKYNLMSLSAPPETYNLAEQVEDLLGEVQEPPRRVGDLTGLLVPFYKQRGHLTPAYMATAFALSEEYNVEWAASIL